MVDRGMTHQEIADKVSEDTGERVNRSSVSAALSRAGLTDRVRYDEVIPFQVRAVHNYHYALTMLRVHARLEAGLEVPEDQVDRYESWKAKLEDNDAVVAYVPDTEDGFHYVHREPEDGDLLTTLRQPSA
tara:strand:+ start:430 stop:819 length:390 start_codon:yes stop_codon:yes gene_type:complete